MSPRELTRIEVLTRLREKRINQKETAELLELSTRQVRRLFKKYAERGAEGIISKLRGRPSNHQLALGVKELALVLIRENYRDFGPTLAHEKLVEVHGMKISVWSVRQIMIQNELWKAKRGKEKRIYQLRERRAEEGELVQIDGSPHDWFEGRSAKCSLLVAIDDATSKIKAALFVPAETVWSYFDFMKIYIEQHGRPKALSKSAL